jgi:hypothetical protein
MTLNTSKVAGFKPGLVFLALFTFAMGSLGCYGWWQADMDQITRLALAFGAGATALVIPFTVIALGRAWASIGVLPVLAVCMLMQAVSFHNFVSVVIEAPHKAAFEKGLQPLQAEVTRTTARLDAAQVDLDAVEAPALPERCKLVACPQTIKANAEAYAAALAPKQAAVNTAKADREKATTALADARNAYTPMIPELALWIVGGLLDGSIALAIWSLEATARRVRKDHEREAKAEVARLERKAEKRKAIRAEKRAALQKKKAAEAKKAAKAKPPQGFKPYVIAANDH